MLVIARQALAGRLPLTGDPALLLEGGWDDEPNGRGQRLSLDEIIDGSHASIDADAAELAERLSQAGELARLNALALRYYLVKLLRVAAFFEGRPALGNGIELHLARQRDRDYHDLFAELARRHGMSVKTTWHDEPLQASRAAGAAAWRRIAERMQRTAVRPGPGGTSVWLCGNPRVLESLCAELVSRGLRVAWLYERFAIRCWLRWRGGGVRQLVCGGGSVAGKAWAGGLPLPSVVYRGLDLSAPICRWLERIASQRGAVQKAMLARLEEFARAEPPDLLLVDEDATPLKRAAIAVSRARGCTSAVIQHGAPCVRFGFAPLEADWFCAWGASTRDQLAAWDVPAERILVTGAAMDMPDVNGWKRPSAAGQRRAARVLLLATVPPRDDRPDSVAFHLTTRTHRLLLDKAAAAVARLPSARLLVKLHPRCNDAAEIDRVLARYPRLDAAIVRRGDLRGLLGGADCVLSCASSAGIEAARSGVPVIQLLPAGSADVLPSAAWGLLGSARQPHELDRLLARALSGQQPGGGEQPPEGETPVFAETGPAAARRIADLLLARCGDSHCPLASSANERKSAACAAE